LTLSKKAVIETVKTEWKRLWQERLDDKVRAEGVATNEYSSIFVEKGTVIHATKDYKALNLRDIIKRHQIPNPDKFIPPNPKIGGWTKFIKTRISSKTFQIEKRNNLFFDKPIKKQQTKKGGRGWLHK
jgi:hypothetical protein